MLVTFIQLHCNSQSFYEFVIFIGNISMNKQYLLPHLHILCMYFLQKCCQVCVRCCPLLMSYCSSSAVSGGSTDTEQWQELLDDVVAIVPSSVLHILHPLLKHCCKWWVWFCRWYRHICGLLHTLMHYLCFK